MSNKVIIICLINPYPPYSKKITYIACLFSLATPKVCFTLERYSLFWKKVQFFSALARFMAFWLDQLHCQSRIRFSLQHLLKRAVKKAHWKKEQEWKYLGQFLLRFWNVLVLVSVLTFDPFLLNKLTEASKLQ